ncbi:hypothetical protein [Streptomyces exfoliatus]|uniref:hypothetical protein n=1 Tax=Streptomyces exfoliatus TaxID=1905 RepID=UPI0004C795BA|nr:hypothetical protein [Streptomyces exfoliatus]
MRRPAQPQRHPGPALAESLDAWAADKTPGTPRPVTDGLDASRFPSSAQYEPHQRARAEHLHTALAKAIQERAEAWDDLNVLADVLPGDVSAARHSASHDQ